MSTVDDFVDILKSNAAEFGKELRMDFSEIKVLMAARAVHLASIVGQTGYDLALRAERDSLALRIGIAITTKADAADQRMLGIIAGALGIAASTLAKMPPSGGGPA